MKENANQKMIKWMNGISKMQLETCSNCIHADVLFCELKQTNVTRHDCCQDFERRV